MATNDISIKTTDKIRKMAIHEACHMIIYMLNCIKENKLPRIKEISIIKKDGTGEAYLIRKRETIHDIIDKALVSDHPQIIKQDLIERVKREIKEWLAGLAGELILLGYPEKGSIYLCETYKLDKNDPSCDLYKALTVSTLIGEQRRDEGATPLLTLFEETVKDVLIYWDEVKYIATILQTEGIINGRKLHELTEVLTKTILRSENNNTSYHNNIVK